MKLQTKILLAALLLSPATISAQTVAQEIQERDEMTFWSTPEEELYELPRWNVKTNLLYDATATVNLGVEFRINKRLSFDLPVNFNAWSFTDERKWKHFLVQPELRLWMNETFRGHFFGLHGHYAQYNVGGLPSAPFSEYMNTHRFEGWLAGAGLSYGYRWNFSRRWALEATIGAGYAYLDYDKFDCGRCGQSLGSKDKYYFGVTKAGVSLIFGLGKAPAKPKPVPVYVAPEPVVVYEPALRAEFIIPEVEVLKARSASGKAYLDFMVGRSEVISSFRNNASELQKIHRLIESVTDDPYSTITGISIVGHASPEGAGTTNQRLSDQRAQALKIYIQSIYGLQNGLFRVYGSGEDWATLDTLVARSEMLDKYNVLSIIRSMDVVDGREKKLMALDGGALYRRMLTEIFPYLRRSDYTIGYTVEPFTVEQARQVFRSRPGNLSLNEMFLIADTYTPGSDAFNDVFETAARFFPESDVANINAAASALNRKDAVSAARYLNRVKQYIPAYWNNMGLLAWFQGNKAQAAECFAKGGAQATGNAAELEKHIQSVSKR